MAKMLRSFFRPRIGLLILLLNVLLVFLPVAGFFYLDVFENELLKAQETSMSTQARLISSGLESAGFKSDLDLQFAARKLFEEFGSQGLTRLRVLNTSFEVLADSAQSIKQKEEPAPVKKVEGDFLYEIASLPFRLIRPESDTEKGSRDQNEGKAYLPALQAALERDYGAWTVVSSGQRSVTLYVAVPIGNNRSNLGLVLASQSTFKILESLYETRKSMFRVFLISLLVAVVLSFFLSVTIASPLKKLEKMASGFVNSHGKPVGNFKKLGGPHEIYSLSDSLQKLGSEIQNHMLFIESFAKDFAHEAKNPLSAIKTANEVLKNSTMQYQNKELFEIIATQVLRLERLIEQSKELSTLELALEDEEFVAIELNELLFGIAQRWNITKKRIELSLPLEKMHCQAAPNFLEQAIDAIVSNAVEFSEKGNVVYISLGAKVEGKRRWAHIEIKDSGPGIPLELIQSITQKFFTTRREQGHLGLGLSMAQTIIHAFKGRLEFQNSNGLLVSLYLPIFDMN